MDTLKNLISEYRTKSTDEDRAMEHLNEISVEEHVLLHAWYVILAYKKLAGKNLSDGKMEEIKREYYWAFTWQDKIKKMSMLSVEEHLEQVCAYHVKQHGFPYKWAWLLHLDDRLYESLIKRYFPWLAKREQGKQEVSELDEI